MATVKIQFLRQGEGEVAIPDSRRTAMMLASLDVEIEALDSIVNDPDKRKAESAGQQRAAKQVLRDVVKFKADRFAAKIDKAVAEDRVFTREYCVRPYSSGDRRKARRAATDRSSGLQETDNDQFAEEIVDLCCSNLKELHGKIAQDLAPTIVERLYSGVLELSEPTEDEIAFTLG